MPHIERQHRKMQHWDTIECIKAIEERDILPLVEQGKACLLHSSEGNNNPDFSGVIANSYQVKRYELTLSTNISFVFVHVFVDFFFDERIKRGRISMSGHHAWFLRQAYENGDRGQSIRLPLDGLRVLCNGHTNEIPQYIH